MKFVVIWFVNGKYIELEAEQYKHRIIEFGNIPFISFFPKDEESILPTFTIAVSQIYYIKYYKVS